MTGGGAPDERAAEEPLVISEAMLTGPVRLDDGRVDFERGMSYAPRVTLAIILACMAVFVWEVAAGALADGEAIVRAGALTREGVQAGQLWRLGTSMFLHAGAGHLIGNCLALYVLGVALEHALGAGRMLAAYVTSGIVGALASVAMGPGPSVGASGAIFGVMGAVLAMLYRYRHAWEVRDKRVGGVLAAWALYILAVGLITPYVDNAAHVGGLACGLLLGSRLPSRLVSA